MKPIKRRFKIWVIAYYAITGYCLGFSVYEDADSNTNKNTTSGRPVVVELAQGFEGTTAYFSHFHYSLIKIQRLLYEKFFCCATTNTQVFPKVRVGPRFYTESYGEGWNFSWRTGNIEIKGPW